MAGLFVPFVPLSQLSRLMDGENAMVHSKDDENNIGF